MLNKKKKKEKKGGFFKNLVFVGGIAFLANKILFAKKKPKKRRTIMVGIIK